METEKVADEASKALRGLTWQRGLTALAVLLGFLRVADDRGPPGSPAPLARSRLGRSDLRRQQAPHVLAVFIGIVTAA